MSFGNRCVQNFGIAIKEGVLTHAKFLWWIWRWKDMWCWSLENISFYCLSSSSQKPACALTACHDLKTFYRGGIFGHDITMTGHRGQKRSLPVCFFPLNQDPTFYPSRSSDFLAPSEFWPPGCNFSHVITCVKRPESGYWASMAGWKIKLEQTIKSSSEIHIQILNNGSATNNRSKQMKMYPKWGEIPSGGLTC